MENDFDYSKILSMLEDITINITWSRINSAGRGRSINFGVGRRRHYKGLTEFKANHTHPEIYLELQNMASILCPFPCNSFIINKNFQCNPHKDKNKSDSVIVGIGDYKGGELVISESTEDFSGIWWEPVEYDIKYTPLQFNGSLHSHWTKDFTGDRYSIVFTNIA